MDSKAKDAFRRELDAAGEAQAGGVLWRRETFKLVASDRRQIIREWLRDQETKRQSRDNLTFWFVV
jgi:tagatose-1,6-bisphosphate aldolase